MLDNLEATGVKVLAFADDIAFVANGTTQLISGIKAVE